MDTAASLARVEAALRQAVHGDGLLGAAASHLVRAQAKRARPRLLLAFARLVDGDDRSLTTEQRLVCAAAAVELIHTASLLHDDVVDAADERRAQPSANARFGNSAAVLAGDLVLARALALLSWEPRAVTAAIDVVARMSEAAVREIELRDARDAVDVAAALAVAEGKTAALFGLCGTLAALALEDGAASSAHAAPLTSAGRAFGVAFQIADDIDDVDVDARDGLRTVPLLAGAETARAIVAQQLDAARSALAPYAGRAGHAEVLAFAAALGRGAHASNQGHEQRGTT